MIFKIVTLFPEFFGSPFSSGLLGKALDKGVFQLELVDLKEYSDDPHRRCDDYPYGGGSGMVLKPEPLFSALESVRTPESRIVLMSPSGRQLTQNMVKDYAEQKEIILVCGNYEGIDQRVIDTFVDDEVSMGDFVLSGGEFAALAMVDAVARYQPGFMSNSESLQEESFEDNLLEYPHYTRPAEFRGLTVPDVLLSGNHGRIAEWRLTQREERTRQRRPDLYKRYSENKAREK